jgi:hypothetical protein
MLLCPIVQMTPVEFWLFCADGSTWRTPAIDNRSYCARLHHTQRAA